MGDDWGAEDSGTEERGHITEGVMCGRREREGLRVFGAPKTLAGGSAAREGRRPLDWSFPRKQAA